MVNLTCSCDGYPPVEIYTWFKEGGDSPVGSGHSYVPLQSGSYYCQAQNQHGAQRSAAVSVLIKEFPYAALHAGVGIGCVLLFFIIITLFFFIRSRNRRRRSQIKEEFSMRTVYAAISPTSAPGDAAGHSSEDQEVLYANVLQLRNEELPRKTSFSGATMEEKLREDDALYAKITFHSSAPANRYDEDMVEDPSALYSTVQRTA
ncbi:uncharacterized protein LOC125785781 [Astyanax mexicanus]|uniref:uncharacterized protein LOC125785781 n=1 Tax=Astyanax mexicanus TaxID=7994 RepID=UPI0020CAEBF7|nr:uncharacterized protein LOC125785781 [Astyanax mexicanus]